MMATRSADPVWLLHSGYANDRIWELHATKASAQKAREFHGTRHSTLLIEELDVRYVTEYTTTKQEKRNK
jgi:hypothetical protein